MTEPTHPEPGDVQMSQEQAAHWYGKPFGQMNVLKAAPENANSLVASNPVFSKVVLRRELIGYLLGVVAVGLFLGVIWASFSDLKDLIHPQPVSPPAVLPPPLAPERFWALIGAHGVVTLALVYFCYQLLRVSERMVLPFWWAEANPEVARIMLGILEPTRAAKKATAELLEHTSTVVGAVARAIAGEGSKKEPSKRDG